MEKHLRLTEWVDLCQIFNKISSQKQRPAHYFYNLHCVCGSIMSMPIFFKMPHVGECLPIFFYKIARVVGRLPIFL